MTPQPTVVVSHGAGGYPVYVAPGMLDELPHLLSHHLPDGPSTVITDLTVEQELDGWQTRSDHPWRTPGMGAPEPLSMSRCTIVPGETSKSRIEWSRLTDELLAQGHGRDSALIAIGGGVVGDLAGFVAATFMRGIPILHVPTTLVAMVDSSIGGKTGIDTGAGKNLVGAFHQPVAVVSDPRCLLTLSDDEFRAGLGEVVKHAVLGSAEYFAWLESNVAQILARDMETITHLITASVRIKAAIVEHDVHDHGRRATLNLGHTVAHGLEHTTAYRLRHGTAVALGLIVESAMAQELGLAETTLTDRIQSLLDNLGVATSMTGAPAVDHVIAAMGYDKKKSSGGTLRFALPATLGKMSGGPGQWTTPVPEVATIRKSLALIGIH